MWLRIASLLGISLTLFVRASGLGDGTKCYDCNYDPSLVAEIKGDDFDWAGTPDRGYPRCSLHPTVDASLVADTVCQGTCFIRRDSNGLVYRGCADPWNLPYHVETSTNCTRKDDGSVWWFCTGSHCNRGTFGQDNICPGDYASYQNDVPATRLAKEGRDDTQPESSDIVSSRFVYTFDNSGSVNQNKGDSKDEAGFSNYRNNLDPYVIMESGWQAYRNELEPKSANTDGEYAEPAANHAAGVGTYQYTAQPMYTFTPSAPATSYRAPVLKNQRFAEHYKSLVPKPGLRTTNAFGPPAHLRSSSSSVVLQQPAPSFDGAASHKSWEGEKYSVTYGDRSGSKEQNVKSAYRSQENAAKSWYESHQSQKSYQPPNVYQPVKSYQQDQSYQSVKSHQPVKSYQPAAKSGQAQSVAVHSQTKSYDSGRAADNQLYILGYGPERRLSGSPAPRYISDTKSAGTQLSHQWIQTVPVAQVFAPPKQQPQPQIVYTPYEQRAGSKSSEVKGLQSHIKSQEVNSKWYEAQLATSKAQQSGAIWQQSHIKSQVKSGQMDEVYGSNANRYGAVSGPKASYLSYTAPSAKAGHAETVKTKYLGPKELPDYKSENINAFQYERHYSGIKGDQIGYNDIPVTSENPCDGDCSANPSGLYPHPANNGWFIQCGSGISEHGAYCTCCKPNYLRCPEGTLFDVNTRVCSTIQELEYGYKPVY